VLNPLDVDVDRLATALFVVLDVENSWLPLTASVESAVTRPAATLVTWRSAPAVPRLTTPTGDAPANPP
jgi:hypothetical protein